MEVKKNYFTTGQMRNALIQIEDKMVHSNWMPNKEKVKEIKESMGQKFYVLENFRRPNPLPRRDVLKVDPPTAAEAVQRAEEDDRTHGGRPVNPRSARQRSIAAAKARVRVRVRRR